MKELFTKFREADIRNIISVITSTGSFAMLYFLIAKGIPPENHDIIVGAVGYILGGANGAVYAYLFSASRSDKKSPPSPPSP